MGACTANGPLAPPHGPAAAKHSPSISPGPTQAPTETPTATPSPTPEPLPVTVPAWAALHASCVKQPAAQEAVLQLQGSSSPVLADVTDGKAPQTLCGITGGPWLPRLATQTLVSWYATQGTPGTNGASVIAVLDLFNGASTVAASWTGGNFMDGLHAWSPDRGFLAYVTSDSNAVALHLLSGGGDRVVASLGAVPGRGFNPNEDDAYLGFSPDGAYFAFVQTFAGSGDQLQVRRTIDGSVAFSLPRATMATWGSGGSRLYYRLPNASSVQVWSSTGGVSQAISQAAWIRPRADAVPDDLLTFTTRDTAGTPHVSVWGHGEGQLPNIRSSPVWLSATTLFYVEEAPCASACGAGAPWQPDGKTFTYDVRFAVEASSKISQVYSAWPRPGQT